MTILLKRGLAATWTVKNPVLQYGEPGIEKDTGRIKIGDGISTWNNLPYADGKDEINKIIKDAPEAYDTFKEISDWINNDEKGFKNLKTTVKSTESSVKSIQDSITPIGEDFIQFLFKERVELKSGQTVMNALANITENQVLVLPANSIVSEDIFIDSNKTIDGKGTTFTGSITVTASANVYILNAIFEKPVVIGG